MNTKKKQTKNLAVVTYCIALICLLAGFFLPLFNGKDMLFKSVPGAIGGAIGINFSFASAFPVLGKYSEFNLFGLSVDLYAWAVAIYAVIVVLGIIALIPVFVSKKHTKTASVFAYIVEIVAVLALAFFIILALDEVSADKKFEHYSMVIALGAVILMFIIQSIGHKKSSGVMKTIMFLLSALAVFFLLNVAAIIPALPLGNIADAINASNGFIAKSDVIYNGTAILFGFDLSVFGTGTGNNMVAILSVVVAAVVLVNFVLDLIALSSNSNKGGAIFNLVRYAIELVAAVVLLILCFVEEGFKPGLLLYAILAVSLIQVLISLPRLVKAVKKARQENEEPEEEEAEENEESEAPEVIEVEEGEAPVVYESSFDEEASPEDTAPVQPAPERVQEHRTVVYTVSSIYRGPTDSFIVGLTEEEKIEFSQIFLEKVKGNFANVPEYVVGGNNADFFSAIFIYLGKFRGILSDGLINKIYKQLSMMN